MFTEESFQVFDLETLETRLAGIRTIIHPEMREIGEKMISLLQELLAERDFHLHLAQHLRRRVNPPEITLSGISENKRGYKMLPHFQISICQDYVAVLLGIIDDPKDRILFADRLLAFTQELPEDFKISKDHMTKEFFDLSQQQDLVYRLKTIKKADFEIGRVWQAAEFSSENKDRLTQAMLETVKELVPLYLQVIGN